MRWPELQWLDRITGSFTMYRLILYTLIALFVETELLSFLGVISQQPLAILASGVVLVGFSYSNFIFAAIFRIKPHGDSALITGLLLLFIFEPVNPLASGAWLQLVGLAVASIVAQASKYLLAWRGRHIFNAAAVGAFVVNLITPFGDFAAWWLASPWLLPVTLVLGFAVLYRTRRLLMGGTFVVVVFFLTFWIYGYGTAGYSLGQVLALPFTSFSTIFFAAFMLSEPLTLPPRLWQQLVEAGIVAAIFTLPFSVGLFSTTTPQFALLVGNLLAFFAGQRRGIRLDFLGREKLTPTSWELSFWPQRPVSFRAGQYMEITIPHRRSDSRGLRRIFSIASSPTEEGVIRFGLNTAEKSSSLKTALLKLDPGEIVMATSVGGGFTLPRDPERRLLFVAGGIGITPFMSHLEDLGATGQDRDIVVVYSASSTDELAYSDRLKKLGVRVLVVAPTAPKPLPKQWTYLGAGNLDAESLLKAVPDVASRAAMVSGPPHFVHALRLALRRAGVHSVRTDFFTGYTPKSGATASTAPRKPALAHSGG
ncbi:MAG TPA: oxidoreductase [Galbitalea sp.]|jgi:ferredoxin-NADP reductase|nr:oxidoreductase [Galbitalea sp.]